MEFALFQIFFYGEIEKSLNSLEIQTRAKVISIFELLEEKGNYLHMPYSKHLDDGLFELKIKSKQNVRIFLCFCQR